jgi:hypothetical protein
MDMMERFTKKMEHFGAFAAFGLFRDTLRHGFTDHRS